MVVGAGFASGRELTDYFLSFGDRWQAGVFISGILFFLVFYCVTIIVNTKNINSCSEYLSVIMDEKTAVFTEWASGLFFCFLYFAMVSATGVLAKEIFNINSNIGVICMVVICMVVMLKGMGIVEGLSVMLVPLLVIGVVLIGLYSGEEVVIVSNMKGSVALSAIIYVSYNTITAASVIAQSEKGRSKVDAVVTGIMCAVVMTVMGLLIGKAILSTDADVLKAEFPFAISSKVLGRNFYCAYIVVFLAAIITTAMCNAIAAMDFIKSRFELTKMSVVCILSGAAIIFSYVKFSDFVSKVFPIFGLAGILQMLNTIKYSIKSR